MKTALKKSFVLIGIALFFVLLPQQRPWLIARPYCVRMLLKKGQTVTACLKMYLKKSIVSPDILKKPVKMQRQYMVIAFVSKVFGGLSVNS